MHRSSPKLYLLCCILLILGILTSGSATEEQPLKQIDAREQYIRVCLTRLGGRDRLDFTFTSPYQLEMDNGSVLYFHAGSQVTFQIENDSIYLYYQEMGQQVGKRAILNRAGEPEDPMVGFRLTNFPALYMGDLQLDMIDGKFRSILSIHVEDYLLGVVPYEMGEAFPLEALKAQAITARTYALRRQGQFEDFDLVDNTNDQVFRGYIAGYARSEKAIKDTRGICGYYKGRLAQCYYSASNGGQTELVQSVWTSREPFDYYVSIEDPYDVANPESVVRRFELLKKYSETKTAPVQFKTLIADYLADTLQKQGYNVSPDNVRIDAVNTVTVDTPVSADSKRMTNLHVELSISVRTKPEFTIRTIDTSPDEVHLFEETAHKEATSSPEVQIAATPAPEYMPFTPLAEWVDVDIPIFPVAEEAFSLNISSNYQNEIWSVKELDDRFVIEVRRYGHGVGMSQRGAQWMAAEHGLPYREILSFYYPGMELIRFPEQERKFVDTEDALVATAGPAPSPTPRPTAMPLTLQAKGEQWIAAVTEISDDSSLNLRSEPGLNSEILMRLYKGQRLLVLERCEDGWVHVRTDSAEGYVIESYLTKE